MGGPVASLVPCLLMLIVASAAPVISVAVLTAVVALVGASSETALPRNRHRLADALLFLPLPGGGFVKRTTTRTVPSQNSNLPMGTTEW